MEANQALVNKHFGPNAPLLNELEQRACLAFVNSHPVMDYSAPLVENVIPIAGLHIKEEKPLPKVKSSLKLSIQFEIIINFV